MERLELNKISILDNNIKEHDVILFEKLKTSIKKRGQLHNIVVCENENGSFDCLAGSKTVKAMRELGFNDIYAINLGLLLEIEKNVIRIEISKDYFLTDYVAIGEMLKTVLLESKINDVCSTLPFDVRQVEKMVSMTEFDWDDFNDNKQNENQVSMFDVIEEVETVSQIELVKVEQPQVEHYIEDETPIETVKTEELQESTDEFLKEMNEIKVETQGSEDTGFAWDLPELIDNTETITETPLSQNVSQESQEVVEQSQPREIVSVQINEYIVGTEGIWNGRTKKPIRVHKISPKTVSYFDYSDEKIKMETKVIFDRLFTFNLATLDNEKIEEEQPIKQEVVNKEEANISETTVKPDVSAKEIIVDKIETPLKPIYENGSKGFKNVDGYPQIQVIAIVTKGVSFILEGVHGVLYEPTEIFDTYFITEKPEKTIDLSLIEGTYTVDEMPSVLDKIQIKIDETKPSLQDRIESNIQKELDAVAKDIDLSLTEELKTEIELLKEELKTDVEEGLLDKKVEAKLAAAIETSQQTTQGVSENDVDTTTLPFFVNDKKVLVITQFKDEILLNLPYIARTILDQKWMQANAPIEEIKITKTENDETKNIEISHVIYVNQYGVRYNLILEELCEMLNKIDFEPQELTGTLF